MIISPPGTGSRARLVPSRLRRPAACVAALCLLTTPAFAGRADVSAKLQARAERACRGDALRFCPGRLYSKVAAVRCLATKRPKLTPACGRAYDDVARALRR